MFELIDFNNLKAFIIEHNLISNSASWAVAVTFTLFIQSVVGDILLPSLYFLSQALKTAAGFTTNTSSVDSVFEKVHKINVANFLKETISFFLILMVIYFIIHYVINNWAQIPSGGKSGNLTGIQQQYPSSSSSNNSSNSSNSTTITQQPFYYSSSGSISGTTGVSS